MLDTLMEMHHRRTLSLALAMLALDPRRHAFAEPAAQPLRIEASAERMRVDGALGEWKGARFAELGSGDDASMRFALASADGGLYLGAEVRDDKLVTGEHGDALVLTWVMPDGQALRSTEITLAPGQAGRSKARALVKSAGPVHEEASIQVVEGPRKSGAGYVLEAFIPWTVFASPTLWEQARAALRLVDADGKGAPVTVASATGAPAGLPRIALGTGQADLLGSFREAQQLIGLEPRYDFRSNVAGDAQPERVVILDRYVLVYGPGYRRGETYNYLALPFGVGGGLRSAVLTDLTGDGHAELVVTLRQLNELGAREVWLVLALGEEGISQLFGIEQRKELAGGYIEDSVSVQAAKRGAKTPRIEVKLGRAQGLDASSYREQPATDLEPILLPWGALAARSYAFDGTRFAVVEEIPQKARPASAAATKATATESRTTASLPASAAGDVLALFKQQNKLSRSEQPSRTLRADVLAASAPEELNVFGSVLVLSGPDIAGGQGYVTYGLPVRSPSDLLDVHAADLTADGKQELLVRVRQPLEGAPGVERELLLVLRGGGDGRLSRVLSVEVARRQGERAIENRVVTADGALRIEPGSARGWSKDSYPFVSEALAGCERLLLPWLDAPQRYRLQNTQLVHAR